MSIKTELTTITNKDIENAELLPAVVSKFKKWLGSEPYIILAWGLYDKSQYLKDLKLHGIESEFKGLFSQYESLKYLHQRIILKPNERAQSMARALKMAKIPLTGTHHRGIDDTRNIAKIFRFYKSDFIRNLNS